MTESQSAGGSLTDPKGGPGAAELDPGAPVLVRVEGAVGRITLNRPASINALDAQMVAAVGNALAGWVGDPAVTAVVLDGAGERGFCAGADVRTLRTAVLEGRGHEALEFLRAEYRLNAFIAEYPKPVVALMDGITMGGGVGLSGHASVRVVTERSRVAMPETRIGFVPDVGGTWLLARAPGRTGIHLGVTAGSVGPGDAVWTGLADYVVPADRHPGFVSELVRGDGDPRDVVAGLSEPAPEAELAIHQAWIDECYDAPTALEAVRRMEQHPEPAARRTAAEVRTLSPTAVAVAYAVLHRAEGLDLRAALMQELRAGTALAMLPDFAEGIRAQLVDKDRQPRWDPATLQDVDPDVVERVLATEADALF